MGESTRTNLQESIKELRRKERELRRLRQFVNKSIKNTLIELQRLDQELSSLSPPSTLGNSDSGKEV